MKDLREKFRPYAHSIDVIDGIAGTDNKIWNDSVDQCVQICKDHAKEFANFVGQRYILMYNVWCGIYQDQRKKENWKTTTQVYKEYEIYQQQK